MRKLSVSVAVGLAFALLGAGLVLAYGRSVDRRIADGKEVVKILVAAKELASGAAADVLKDQVQIRDMPKAYVAEGALTTLDQVAGLVLLSPIAPGFQLNRMFFGPPSKAASITPSPGKIAVAAEMDVSPGVARYVGVGSIVDVFVTYQEGASQGNVSVTQTGPGSATIRGQSPATNRTKLFVSGVRVLAVSVAERQQDAPAQDPARDDGRVIVVLDVTPPEGEAIVNAVSIGKLYLGLSTPGARHTTPTGVVPDDVVSSNR